MLQKLLDEACTSGLSLELIDTISRGQGSAYLEAIAGASFDSRFTDLLLPLYHPIAAEISQRWLNRVENGSIEREIAILACFARVLPFATYLKPKVKDFLRGSNVTRILTTGPDLQIRLDHSTLQSLILALFRLLSHDLDAFIDYVKPIFLCSLFSHEYRPVRYLSIDCFCQVMRFADALNQDLIKKYVGEGQIDGVWEGKHINFQLLEIQEEQRWFALQEKLQMASTDPNLSLDTHLKRFSSADLCLQTTSIGGVLVPRRSRATRPSRHTFVTTQTATVNLRNFAQKLHQSKPILLSGPSGAGKTTLVHEAARQLDRLARMVTLHLNDQTDAKTLLGIYTSSSSGNGFVWQPGVLTNAVEDGRWVLIEDIDRAPADVIGLLRPLIENDELFIPSRKERLKPGDGFRIIGTIRDGRAISSSVVRNSFLSNPRLWSKASVVEYPQDEVRQILQSRFPKLELFLDQIMAVHNRLVDIYVTNTAFKTVQARHPTIRDLIKWCRRLIARIAVKQISDSNNVFTETFIIEMLKECVDCYASHFQDWELLYVTASNIAEILNIPPVTVSHIMRQSDCVVENEKQKFRVGRTALTKLNSTNKKLRGSAGFALTRTVRRNMEAIVSAVAAREPLLLVGETGVGKTTIVQYVASSIGQSLTVINLSNQSEASDLLGGLKPITTRSLMVPLIDDFNNLFDDTFSSDKNEKFQQSVARAFTKQRWARLLGHWQEAVQLALKMLPESTASPTSHEQVSKKRKLNDPKRKALRDRWTTFNNSILQMMSHVEKAEQNQIFAFVESRLVKAVRDGSWLLLDEINLASSETLDNILSLFHDGEDDMPYLLLAESGKIERIEAHPNFRIFAAMNPATDTGKRDLPPAIRAHFTELYVHAGDDNLNNLIEIIQSYLGTILDNDKKAGSDLAKSYLALKKLNAQHKLTDGAGDLPHFSLRSLTRCLLYIQQNAPFLSLRRAMYEGLQMSFFTVLDHKSQDVALPQIERYLLDTAQARREVNSRRRDMPEPSKYVTLQQCPILRGLESADRVQNHYIHTQSVDRNLSNLARAASMKRFPILLQGPTSAGKTSMVEYLARYSGNKFVRINNHEHTDLQEYLGSYASGPDGRLEYREGVLVEALRNGYWIVLDELNLAPSDVLEALNRLLDDNRELLIPESQEIVRPHPNFMLFATQNPAGIYGGRKRLSRAFRNRFLELHIEDIPENELEMILTKRAQIPPSFCRQIVEVYKRLSLQRQSSRLFEQRNSFATLRDLFRWASRPLSDREELAHHGYMLLAERVRDLSEKENVKATIEEVFKVKVNDEQLYNIDKIPQSVVSGSKLTWTWAMRRLFVLLSTALQNNEPVLLVGETGCGKTQVCQAIAQAFGRELHIYNAHSNTETGDLIGSQRPVRHKTELVETLIHDLQHLGEPYSSMRSNDNIGIDELIIQFKNMDTSTFDNGAVQKVKQSIAAYQSLFTWNDGSLVRAMKEGAFFLLDEISLADDSVLERMNSVLEPARSILLAEKGAEDNFVVANTGFQFFATMNPGGDYGKRELSAALRNRLTEIWVPPLSDDEDILPILRQRLLNHDSQIACSMLEFARYFVTNVQDSRTTNVPLRTLLNWADFVSEKADLGIDTALIHGAGMNFIDSLGTNPAGLTSATMADIQHSRETCLKRLGQLTGIDASETYNAQFDLQISSHHVRVGPFSIQRSSAALDEEELVLSVPTTLNNCMRIVRALQVKRPILLEGNPGVGKTAIVSSLARICGNPLTRINLSDQTDLVDLFGADHPAENENVGSFIWRDGPMLTAMQTGGWLLLDEMNLASQSVLEGLNACLDHRKEIYIAELDKTFKCHPNFMLFATQNPHHQGGGRKGLPASFVNRFTVVYADPFQQEDLFQICKIRYPSISETHLARIISVLEKSQEVALRDHELTDGGPWELNLRDLSRWLTLCNALDDVKPSKHFNTVIGQRFRSRIARIKIKQIARDIFGSDEEVSLYHNISPNQVQVGVAFTSRHFSQQSQPSPGSLSAQTLPYAESVLLALSNEWPTILVGKSNSGKTTLIRSLAAFSGAKLVEFSMNSDIDTADLIGGYEQYDVRRDYESIKTEIANRLISGIVEQLRNDDKHKYQYLSNIFKALRETDGKDGKFPALIQALSVCSLCIPDLREPIDKLRIMEKDTQLHQNRFVWNDGVLIEAIQSGSWLVLDNANLCNPSVLDRLNSLLEPGGSLIVSEQYSVDGKPRIIRPHPGFRIILTMDPRFGELSRAMRNRSLEVFMNVSFPDPPQYALPVYSTISSTSRLRVLMQRSSQGDHSRVPIEPWISQLSHQDMLRLCPTEHSLQSIDPLSHLGQDIVAQMLPEYTLSIDDVLADMSIPKKTNRKGLQSNTDFPQVVLINEPLVLMMLDIRTLQIVFNYSRLQFIAFSFSRCQIFLQRIKRNSLNHTKNHLSILQKSAAFAQKRKRGAYDEKISAFEFLEALASFCEKIIKNCVSTGMDWKVTHIVQDLVRLLQDLMTLFDQPDVPDNQLQAYKELSFDFLHHLGRFGVDVANEFRDGILPLLGGLWRLTSGLGLQKMWPTWKGYSAASLQQLEARLSLQGLLRKFDRMSKILPITRSQLADLRLKLTTTITDMLGCQDAIVPIGMLENAVDDLAQIETPDSSISGHFSVVFDIITSKLMLQNIDIADLGLQKLILFGDKLCASGLCGGKEKSNPIEILQRMEAIATLSSHASIAPGELSTNLILARLKHIDEQPLDRIRYAQEEFLELVQTFSSRNKEITAEAAIELRQNTILLIFWAIEPHCHDETKAQWLQPRPDILRTEIETISLIEDTLLSIKGDSDYLTDVAERYFLPAVKLLKDKQYGTSSRALLLVSLGCLKLLVTDRAFDPATFPQLVKSRHESHRVELTSRLEAWKIFQQQTTGQESSMIIRMLERDIEDLGNTPTAPVVYRPDNAYMTTLQGEYINIIRTVIDANIVQDLVTSQAETSESMNQIKTQLKMRVNTCIQRLSSIHPAYEDLVMPVKGLLHALSLSASMISHAETITADLAQPCHENSVAWLMKEKVFDLDPPSLSRKSLTQLFTHLKYFQLRIAHARFSKQERMTNVSDFVSVIDQFYIRWKKQLTKDQAIALAESKYYTYRGQDEGSKAETQELQELFPTFTEDQVSSIDIEAVEKTDVDWKTMSIKLAENHRSIWSDENVVGELRQYLKTSTEGHTSDEPLKAEAMPALMLAMEERLKVFEGVNQTRGLNVYTDSSMVEARKLFELVRLIQKRFKDIVQVWPEHAVAAEALGSCRYVLASKINDPIAMLLTKTEKLLEIVAQWQSVASREWSVQSLIETLTQLIIHWRRLELSSWSRLLDMEDQKTKDAADAWYFIAYEAVIYNSLLVVEEPRDIPDYCKGLAKTLEEFLKLTTLGQFSPRLRLLTVLSNTISALAQKDARLTKIQYTLTNVLTHYARYEDNVTTQLASGRAHLEKDIVEQIHLASWKDTNITALKDSARRSHYKLFKVVKKYRALLGQPIVTLEARRGTDKAVGVREMMVKDTKQKIDLSMHIFRCSTSIESWSTRPERLRNTTMAAKTMRHIYDNVISHLDVPSKLHKYEIELCAAIKELRDTTPSVLTDQNSSLVRDLKQRKRRLLAETMRELTQMGMRRNLSTAELDSQSSTSQILSNTPTLNVDTTSNIPQADERFHEMLDVMVSAREAAFEHSEELTDGEVRRGLGLLEGFLCLAIEQRRSLAGITEACHRFRQISVLLKNLGMQAKVTKASSRDLPDQDTSLKTQLAWTLSVMQVFEDILKFQSFHHGTLNVTEVVDGMQKHAKTVVEALHSLDASPRLPQALLSEETAQIHGQIKDFTTQFESELVKWTEAQPQIEFLTTPLRQILMKLKLTSISQKLTDSFSVPDFDEESQNMLGSIFVLLQNMTEKLKTAPNAIDELGWLTQTSKVYAQATYPALLNTLSHKLNHLLAGLHSSEGANIQLDISLMLNTSPVVLQLESIYSSLLELGVRTHIESCKLATLLGKTFTSLAREGFCTPAEPTAGEEQSGKIEQGTGLGDGEAAEDISKDVGDDEDLTDLAKAEGERDKSQDEIEKSKDAVDLGADDLEGEMGSGDERGSDDDDGAGEESNTEDEEIDQETGSVDDLDPSAVDEKMWDAMQKEMEQEQKEMKGQKAKGTQSDEQTAGQNDFEDEVQDGASETPQDIDENDDQDEEGVEGEQKREGENLDQHLDQEAALELPEEMQLNGEEEKAEDMSDIDMDDISDVSDRPLEDRKSADLPNEDEAAQEDKLAEDNVDDSGDETADSGKVDEPNEDLAENRADEQKDDLLTTQDDLAHTIQDQDAGDSGIAAMDQSSPDNALDDNTPQQQQDSANAAQKSKSQGGRQSNAEDQGAGSEEMIGEGTGQNNEQNRRQDEAIQRLSDVLDHYHRRREIFTASENRRPDSADQDVDMTEADFEHVNGETEDGSAQALGTANTDANQQFDQDKAIEASGAPVDDDIPAHDDENEVMEEDIQESLAEKFTRVQNERAQQEHQSSRSAIIPESVQKRPERDLDQDIERMSVDEDRDDFDEGDDHHLLSIPPSSNTKMSMADAQQLWSIASTKTQALSMILTEQLRLILHPTTATKLRGDFRTGKRLNIRRIIPYIASGYKRDKIWMRRSVPSKRNYQIMLAVDDSKSMAESGADILALETLCMLSRSLSMLEAGELSIVAFGQDYSIDDDYDNTTVTTDSTINTASKSNTLNAVKVAHPFTQPFSPNQSGPTTFSKFTFAQTGTNVRALLAQSIALFADARVKSSARDAADLWQLQIIISDGHIGSDSDDGVRRLVRQAREAKIMCVFVVVDSGEESIVDLKEVSFDEMSGEVSTRRYLENFPFQYYVVVREIRDLPGVLSRVLKGWFEGVVEQG